MSGLNDAITHATTLPGIDPKRIGLLGFSLGGHLGLRVRSSLKMIVEFFAPVLDGIGTGSPGSQLHVQIHHGRTNAATRTGDSLVPFEANAIPIAQELREREYPPICTSIWVQGTGSLVPTPQTRTLRHGRRHERLLSSNRISEHARWSWP